LVHFDLYSEQADFVDQIVSFCLLTFDWGKYKIRFQISKMNILSYVISY